MPLSVDVSSEWHVFDIKMSASSAEGFNVVCFQEFRDKRSSRDIETWTDDALLRVTLRRENKSVSTDTIEEVVDDDPFAGELHLFQNIF